MNNKGIIVNKKLFHEALGLPRSINQLLQVNDCCFGRFIGCQGAYRHEAVVMRLEVILT